MLKGVGLYSRLLVVPLLLALVVDALGGAAVATGTDNPVAVAAGMNHVLLLTSDGNVWAWGSNGYGECGYSGSDVSEPVKVPISDVKAVAAGRYFSMALKNDGTVWAWGSNDFGQLGIGKVDNSSHPDPIQVKGLKDITAIACCSVLAMALDSTGAVWAWGQDNSGQVGDGNPLADPGAVMASPEEWNKWVTANVSIPTRVVGLSGVDSIVSGGAWALALKDDGSVWYWGQNSSILGDENVNLPNSIGTSRPILVQTIGGIRDVGAGSGCVLIVKDDGTVWGWGTDINGILGRSVNQSYVLIYEPVQIPGLSGIRSIAPGVAHCAALDDNGNVWTWGSNYKGQIGNGEVSKNPRLTPYKVPVSGVRAIASSYLFTVALASDGSIWAWGSDERGAIGDGSSGEGLCRPDPVRIVLGEDATQGPATPVTATSPPAGTVSPGGTSATPPNAIGASCLPGLTAALAGVALYLIGKKSN